MRSINKFYFTACKCAGAIALLAWVATRGKGIPMCFLTLIGIIAALTNRRGISLSCFIMFPVFFALNPVVFPLTSIGSAVCRASTLVIAALMIFSSTRSRGKNILPLGGMLPYLLLAGVSSAQGYFPQISYLKLLNFIAFLMGIWMGTRNMQNSPKDMEFVRMFLAGMSIFIIVGSLLTLPFPAISYAQNVKNMAQTMGVAAAEAVFKKNRAFVDVTYFCGVTRQSQCLGPLLAAVVLWLVADMLFIVRKITLPAILLVGIGVGEMYLTRSRTSLLAFLVGGAVLVLYAVKHTPMRLSMKKKVRRMVASGMWVMIGAAVVFQIMGGGVSQWIRKRGAGDANRSLIDDVTSSRQQLIEMNLRDFHYNELLGCGFQVEYEHQFIFQHHEGLIMSAPIEKGVLPLMILGESGLIGFIVFCGFLVVFYAGCKKRSLYVTMSLFSVLLASNMGEADFFSPGGVGGAKWVLCVVGGFIVDTYLLYHRRMEAQANRWKMAMMASLDHRAFGDV